MGDMADADIALAFLYRECALRQHRLIDWVNGAVERLKR